MKRVSANALLWSIVFAIGCARNQTVSNTPNQNVNAQVASASTQLTTSKETNHTRSEQNSYKPKNGYVPDQETAISIAVAVWIPIYGKEQIDGEKPYKAALRDGVWTVTGSLPEGYVGGTAVAEISRDSGCVLRVIHYK